MMPEKVKEQIERISSAIDKLDTTSKEAALAYMQGMAAGAQLAEAVKPSDAEDN